MRRGAVPRHSRLMKAGTATSRADPPGTASRRRILAPTRLDFWLDAVLLVAYSFAYSLGFTGILHGHDPGVRRPVTEVGLIRIQDGRSRALAHECRPSWLSRPISASSSTTSARPLTRTLHPDWVMSS
jgi:hypothetical protein